MSTREAARRAGISEARWRQIERGHVLVQGIAMAVKTKPPTVLAMAEAVGVQPEAALRAAGFSHLVPELLSRPRPQSASQAQSITRPRPTEPIEALIQEIYDDERIPEERKPDLVRRIRQAEAERQAVQDELNRWRRAG